MTVPENVVRAMEKVRRRIRLAALLGAGAVSVLAVTTSLPFLDALGIPAFYLVLPALAIAQLPLLGVERLERIPVYLGSMVGILILGAVGLVLSMRLEGVAPAGLTGLPTPELLLWTGGVTVAGLVVVALFHPLEKWAGGGHSRILNELLPRNRRERGLFAGLSFSAGVGEELAYRAYAFQAIQLFGPGAWAAAALSSIPFGLLHAYQGPVGVVRTATMGFVLAVPVVMTGSLLPSMAAHTLLDLLLGIVIGPRLVDGDGPGSGAMREEGAVTGLVHPDHEE